jgi:CHAD domain-containing protein
MNAQLASDRVITNRLRALADSLPAVLEAAPEGVHKARVASRRVREALPVVLAQAPARRSARLRRAFRRVTRALGPLREIDVTLNLLDQLAAPSAAGVVLDDLHHRLEQERGARRDDMLSRLDAIDFESLVGRIERLMDDRADESDEARALPAAIEGTLGLRVARRVRALEVAVARAGSLYAIEPLHEVRIATKKLRYVLELAVDMKALRSRRPLRTLHDVQDALGRLHDDHVLGDWIRRVARDHEVAPEVTAALDRVDRRCREHHARYLELRAKAVGAAEQALTAITAPHAASRPAPEPAATVH